MSVVVKIKGKIDFNKLVNENYDYGVRDTAYRLNKAPDGCKLVVFYDNKSIGRGIEVELLKNEVELKLASASTRDDVKLFYYLIKIICETNNQDVFIREGEKKEVKDLKKLLSDEIENNISSFETLKTIIKQMGGNISIFGTRNPIDIDLSLLEHLNNNYDNYEKYICDIQHLDAYYCAPFVLVDDKNKRHGIFTVHPNGLYIVPIEPFLNNADAPENYKVDYWHIGDENGLVNYDDFIKVFGNSALYDANHIVVELTKDKYNDLISKYGIDLNKF